MSYMISTTQAAAIATQAAKESATVWKESATRYRIRYSIPDAPAGTLAEVVMMNIGEELWDGDYGNIWVYAALFVKNTNGSHQTWCFLNPGLDADVSVTEYASQIHLTGQTIVSGNFFGNGHGFENTTSLTITLDGVDITGMAVDAYQSGSSVVFTQNRTIRNPHTNAAIAGASVIVKHTFTASGASSGCVIRSEFTFTAATVDMNVLYLMAPMMCALEGGGADRMAFTGDAEETIDYADATVDWGTGGGTKTGGYGRNSSLHSYRYKIDMDGASGPEVTNGWLYSDASNQTHGSDFLGVGDFTSDYAKLYFHAVNKPGTPLTCPTSMKFQARYYVTYNP
jgi:hypothetical protein